MEELGPLKEGYEDRKESDEGEFAIIEFVAQEYEATCLRILGLGKAGCSVPSVLDLGLCMMCRMLGPVSLGFVWLSVQGR